MAPTPGPSASAMGCGSVETISVEYSWNFVSKERSLPMAQGLGTVSVTEVGASGLVTAE